jgi:antitoxin CptB
MLDRRNPVALTHRVPPQKASMMSDDDIGARRRRALWRATHRGYKEMDFLLGKFATEAVIDMDDVEIAVFERLIDRPDPEIEMSFFGGQSLGAADLDELMVRLRRFHGVNEAG